MIVGPIDRNYVIHARRDKDVPWEQATYCGRWEEPEIALAVAKSHMGGSFEYRIDSLNGEFVETGFVEDKDER